MPTPLEQSIVRTLAYFDIVAYPLTAFELWKYLYHPDVPLAERSLMNVIAVLGASEYLNERVSLVEGFYCFKGREAIVAERKRRNNRVDHQMHYAIRMSKWLRLVPTIRMIGIMSSLSYGNVKDESDIDLCIVAKKNTIWLTRFFATGFFKVLGLRPDERKKKDRFCLSFFITEDALNVSQGSYGSDDIAYQYYVQSMLPIYDPDHIAERFVEENAWLAAALPNAAYAQASTIQVTCPRWVRVVHAVAWCALWPFFGRRNAEWYCMLQLRILPQRLKQLANIDSRVILSDTMLKFHDKDNRQELKHAWHARVTHYA